MNVAGTPNGIPTGINWQKAAALMSSEKGRRDLAKAMTDYFNEIRGKAPLRTMVGGDKTTRTGHNQIPQREMIDVRVYSEMADLGLLSLFRYVDKRQSNNPTHKYINVNGGQISFRERMSGQKALIQPVTTGTTSPLESVTHEGALGIDDDEARFDDYSIFEQSLQMVPGKWDNYVASQMAVLIKALTGITESWDTDLVKTVNNACTTILDNCGDLYGVADGTAEFGLVFNPAHVDQVQKAINSSYGAPNDNVGGKQFAYSVRPIMTRKLSSADGIHVVLPGNDMIDAEWDPLYSEYTRSAELGTDAWIYRSRRNQGIGNSDQLRKITPQ